MSDTIPVRYPRRIQRKRSKGWQMPPNTVYVGRPSRYGNPYHLQPFCPKDMHCDFCCLTRDEAVTKYRGYITKYLAQSMDITKESFLAPLRGKDLACWCRLDQACHADALLELLKGEYA